MPVQTGDDRSHQSLVPAWSRVRGSWWYVDVRVCVCVCAAVSRRPAGPQLCLGPRRAVRPARVLDRNYTIISRGASGVLKTTSQSVTDDHRKPRPGDI